jgi:hypothetical protein
MLGVEDYRFPLFRYLPLAPVGARDRVAELAALDRVRAVCRRSACSMWSGIYGVL